MVGHALRSNIFFILPVPHYTVLRPPPRYGKNEQTHLLLPDPEDNGEKSTVLYSVAAVRTCDGGKSIYLSRAVDIHSFGLSSSSKFECAKYVDSKKKALDTLEILAGTELRPSHLIIFNEFSE